LNSGSPAGDQIADKHSSPVEEIQAKALEAQVVEALRTCYDPEIPVNIYDLGLIYDIEIGPAGGVKIAMTLTSPGCPVAGMLVADVESKAKSVDGVSEATVELVWDPPWSPERMSESAKLQLNL
jgi:FeS assembly SUF system protein